MCVFVSRTANMRAKRKREARSRADCVPCLGLYVVVGLAVLAAVIWVCCWDETRILGLGCCLLLTRAYY